MVDYSLYLCTDSEMNKKYPIEKCVEQAILGGVTLVQIREKGKSKEEILSISQKVKLVTSKLDVPLIINDHIDIAIEVAADGVHLGQDDISCTVARQMLGKNKIIGISVRNVNEAKKAIADGADYLGVGAIYKSNTKPDAVIVGQEELDKIIKVATIPVVVIGGINEQTIPNFKGKNVAGYAMISPILRQNNIVEAVSSLRDIIHKNNN